ncbi:MAG TPA: TonB family protein [Bryobacteraceae bacterium]|nr:TonB family protein [Bryobacteraceae bacterium]
MAGAWKDWEGQVVDGRFPLRRFLGSGERSAVFLTQYGDSQPQNAAIKLFQIDSEDPEIELARWKRAARLSHPSLLRFFQTGTFQTADAGLLYVVMEYGEENLADVLRDRPLTEVEAREMLEPVLDALAYLHGEGFVHGHLKPSNILAVADHLKISNDAVCKVGEACGRLRHPSVYDPPEFLDSGFSPAADVWSLGMTLVEALTQRLPSNGTAKYEPVLPETLPEAFVDIARQCLQMNPRERAAVADIAARVRHTSAMPAERGAAAPQAVSQSRRYVAPIAVVAGLALVVVLAGPRLLRRTPPTTSEQPTAPAVAAQTHAEPANGQVVEKTSGETRGAAGAVSPPTSRSGAAPAVKSKASAGRVVHEVLPDVPRQARDTIHGTVKVAVRARVDLSGHVVSAHLDSPGPSKYLAARTLEAARKWEFRPPKFQGGDISSEWILRFELTRTSTIVHPTQVSP